MRPDSLAYPLTIMRQTGLASIAAGFLLLLAAACSDDSPSGAVHVIEADGTIGPIMDRFLDRAISRAENSNAKLAVIRLDTPGGLNSSMREIVQRIERADVPVAVYVWPPGGRAASAGTFITMAGHIAAMAPSTSIGAASAINLDGSDIEGALGRKVENDAVAFIRGIAELRGRNADWAEEAVRDAVAVNQSEAVELNVVDFVANDIKDLLAQAEGRSFELRPGVSATLTGLDDAPRVSTGMTIWEKFLGYVADPTLASLLISIGVLAIIIEIGSPGLGIPGAIGVMFISLGFLGFGVLPVDAVGLVLLLLGIVLIISEMFVSGGVLGGIGTVAVILGTVIAFRDTPSDLRPPIWVFVVGAIALASALALVSLAGAWIRRSTDGGAPTLVGRLAVARTNLGPDGWVFIDGERWQAVLEGKEAATTGDRVRVTKADGLRLHVTREDEE